MNYNDLDLNLLKTFLCVYENKSILTASKKLYLTQPAVSNSIKKLEIFLGGELFIRTSKGVMPTAEGEKFNSYCYNAMKHIENGINDFISFTSLEKGKLNIGSSSTIIRQLLMPFIAEFSKMFPKIIIMVLDANSAKLLKQLKNGDVDLVIMNTPVDNEEMFDILPLKETKDCFIAGIDFEKDFISKEDLKNYPIILQKRPSNNRDYFEKICLENGIEISPKYEIGSFGLLTDFVSSNMGLGFTVKDFVEKDIQEKRVKEIKTDLKISPRKVVVVSKPHSVDNFVCKKFIDKLVKYFESANM